MRASQTFFEAARSGRVGLTDLHTLLASGEGRRQWIREDEYVDFKAAAWIADRKKLGNELRVAIAAFANSDGGTLVVGVSQPKPDHERGPADLWVLDPLSDADADALSDDNVHAAIAVLAPLLYPPPRITSIHVQTGVVVVIAVDRAPSLVWFNTPSGPRHYFRFGSRSEPAPVWLVADLLLRRRAKPSFEIREARVPNPDRSNLQGDLTLDMLNNSPVHVDDMVAGLVRPAVIESEPTAPSSLSGGFDASVRPTMTTLEVRPEHALPFRRIFVGVTNPIPYFGELTRTAGIAPLGADAALFIAGRDVAPMWFQVVLTFHPTFRVTVTSATERPRVGYRDNQGPIRLRMA